MMSASLDDCAQQKALEKKLSALLYKKGYCFCIPDLTDVQTLLQKMTKSQLIQFLMQKNPMGLSIVAGFLLILIKNKQLNPPDCLNLVKLINLLLSHLETSHIDTLLLEKTTGNPRLVCWFIDELLKTKTDSRNVVRRQALADCLSLLLEKVSSEMINKIILEPVKLLQKLMRVIAYTPLSEVQLGYLVVITKTLIHKADQATMDICLFQVQTNGFSFIWCSLAAWLVKVDESLADRLSIDGLGICITLLLKKATAEKLPELLWEEEGEGLRLILAYTLLTILPTATRQEKEYLSVWYRPWLEKLFLTLNREQGERLLRKTFEILIDNIHLDQREKQKVESQFFSYLLQFSNLTPQDYVQLKCLRKQLAAEFFPVRTTSKHLSVRQVLHRISFFSQCFRSHSSEAPLELSERSTLLKHSF
jgi:hypothetical protein